MTTKQATTKQALPSNGSTNKHTSMGKLKYSNKERDFSMWSVPRYYNQDISATVIS
jgi:hypothetical protein